jgi:hypothetical protein
MDEVSTLRRPRARAVLGILTAGALAMALVSTNAATALDDEDASPGQDVFELDGNTADATTPGLPDDWDRIYSNSPDHDAFATSGIVADPAPGGA